MSQGRKLGGEFAGVGLNVEIRASGVMQWDIWDEVGIAGMDRHTLIYVDWWMDRKAVAINDGREEEVLDLQRMAEIEIVSM